MLQTRIFAQTKFGYYMQALLIHIENSMQMLYIGIFYKHK